MKATLDGIIMEAAKTAAMDLRERTGDLYEMVLMGLVPVYTTAQLPLTEFHWRSCPALEWMPRSE